MHIIINLKCANLIFGGIVTELCLALEDCICIVCIHVYMYMYMYTFSHVQYRRMYMLMIVSVKFSLIAFLKLLTQLPLVSLAKN